MHNIRYATIEMGANNTPALSRLNKGTVSSDKAPAFLCNLECAHQCLQ